MNRQPFEKPPRWWSPKLSPLCVRLWRVFRLREQRRKHRLLQVHVHGSEQVRELLDSGHGVLLTPNHSSHADCFALYGAADRIGVPCYAMMAWQVFARGGWVRQQMLRLHGSFSIDREGTDLTAIRTARDILQNEPYPLAIFPEGEVYHLNERVTPFREGPAAIALMAAKKGPRPIACVPCGMRYVYTQDPTSELLQLMDRLEESVHWRPRRELSLPQRIYHIAEGILALKEIEILGQTSTGSLPDRVHELIEFLLRKVELRHGVRPGKNRTVPERVKSARQTVIAALPDVAEEDAEHQTLIDELDDLFLVVQAFSYPGDYVEQDPSIERIAETLDKFEEDLLGVKTATIRGAREAYVTLGEPIVLSAGNHQPLSAAELTHQLQERVAELLTAPIGRGNALTAGDATAIGNAATGPVAGEYTWPIEAAS